MTTVFVHGLPETHRIWDSLRANLDRDSITIARLVSHGVPIDQARAIGAAHDETMSQSILDFYRSAVPNVSAGWWDDITGPAPSRGLVLLLPDPPEVEAMSLEVADRLGADTARLDGLNHCWMAEAPEIVAPVLERFWSSLGSNAPGESGRRGTRRGRSGESVAPN